MPRRSAKSGEDSIMLGKQPATNNEFLEIESHHGPLLPTDIMTCDLPDKISGAHTHKPESD